MAYTLYVHNKEMGNIMHAIDNTESQDNFYSCLNRAYIRRRRPLGAPQTAARATLPEGSPFGESWFQPAVYLHMRSG